MIRTLLVLALVALALWLPPCWLLALPLAGVVLERGLAERYP